MWFPRSHNHQKDEENLMKTQLLAILSKIRIVLSLFVLLVASSVSADGNWPGFRGPNFDGSVVDGKFAPQPGGTLAVNWRTAIGPGYSGVSVWDGQAVTLFSDGTKDVIAAFDLKSGKELWRTPLATANKGHDGSHDGPLSTPSISNGKVFALLPEGDLVAVELASGKQIWKTNLVENGGKKPFYGFTASPVVADGVVVVEIGGESGKAVAGFDVQTGKVKWTAGSDVVNYQSPLLIQAGGRQLVLAVSDKKLFAIDPASGTLALEYEHGGDDAASIMVPVLLDENRILLRNKNDSADLIRINSTGNQLAVEKIWTKDIFKNSYCVPVYYKGTLFGFNGRVLTAVDAATGETKWRSRGVGDGWLLLVDGNLVIQTKMGSLHVGPASADGWKETAKVDLFKDVSWTPPIFASGTIVTRSQKEMARLQWQNQPAAAAITSAPILPATSQFGKFLTDLEKASDKKAAVDQFMASQKTFPIVEWPDYVTFVYQGPVEDIAIGGDLQGSQREESLKRIDGTDLFYYSARLEPDARINYRFIKNFEETISDPKNPRTAKDRRGNPMSWMGMPGWEAPDHLKEAPASKRGRIEKQELPSKVRTDGSSKFEVYVPAGYDASTSRYPVVYIFDGARALADGQVANTLDNVTGNSVQPLIAVFLTELKTGKEPLQDGFEEANASIQLLVEEVIPFVDSKYRTLSNKQSRAVMAPLDNGYDALYSALHYPEMFGGVALQSMWIDTRTETRLKDLIRTADQQPLQIYLDWGLYDAHSVVEDWDLREENAKFDGYLREKGYRPAGGEAHDSYGWTAWRNRTDRWLAALFPLKN
jgi:enterochelin esterase-like enzyme/outer membrane protein assembly factor BamB